MTNNLIAWHILLKCHGNNRNSNVLCIYFFKNVLAEVEYAKPEEIPYASVIDTGDISVSFCMF